jgi:hypothetical protein
MENEMTNPLQSIATLNFAFCPAELLDLDEKSFGQSSIFGDLFSQTAPADGKEENERDSDADLIDYFKNYIKYYYVCYSFELDENLYGGKSYFYFQIFYQAGTEQGFFEPFFGIFSEKEIFDFLKDVDSLFSPDPHEKIMFDNTESPTGSCQLMVQLMQQWTALKLIEFNNEYIFFIKDLLLKAGIEQSLAKETKIKPQKTNKQINPKTETVKKKTIRKTKKNETETEKPTRKPKKTNTGKRKGN